MAHLDALSRLRACEALFEPDAECKGSHDQRDVPEGHREQSRGIRRGARVPGRLGLSGLRAGFSGVVCERGGVLAGHGATSEGFAERIARAPSEELEPSRF